MALDTFVVREDGTDYQVLRYKSTELCESMKVPLAGPVASSVEKRRRIVEQWIEEGKPRSAIYWFEGDSVEGTKLEAEELKVGDIVQSKPTPTRRSFLGKVIKVWGDSLYRIEWLDANPGSGVPPYSDLGPYEVDLVKET